MKFVIQRVNWAKIQCFDIDNNLIYSDSIDKGLVVYVGISKEDIDRVENIYSKIEKIVKFPLFDDNEWKIKLSIQDIKWEILLIPNFTLYGRNKKWVSIDYTYSAPFNIAKNIFDNIYKFLSTKINVKKVIFGSYMKIQSEVDGPVNFVYEI